MARKSRKQLDVVTINEVGKPKFQAGAYIRLSVVDRKSKGDSLENQQAIINSFIAEYSDIELREIYIDNGHSGQSFERPAFLRMIADMECGKINCCVTKDLSRLGRNAIDSGYYIERHFPSLGVRYIAITDGYDSANGQSGGIILSLKNMVNESYALDASRKVRATVKMNINKGNFIGGVAPYGYFKSSVARQGGSAAAAQEQLPQEALLRSQKPCHKLIIDEHTAPVVRRIFEMAAEGHSHKAILNWLNDSEHLPPRRYFLLVGLATENEVGVEKLWWGIGAVKDILQNQKYCGDMVQGRHKMVDNAETSVPKSKWVVVADTHEPIVSRELFDKAQATFTGFNTAKEPTYRNPNTENIFLRKVYCDCCGYAMTRRRYSEYAYNFRCSTRFRYSPKACPGNKISEIVLKSAILGLLCKYAKCLNPQIDSVSPDDSSKELHSVQSEYDRNKRFLEGLYESLVSGDISEGEYKDMKSAYEDKMTALAEQIKHLQEAVQNQVRQTSSLSHVQKLEDVSDITAEVIDKLVERITVHTDGQLEVKFSFIDETVYSEEVAEHE